MLPIVYLSDWHRPTSSSPAPSPPSPPIPSPVFSPSLRVIMLQFDNYNSEEHGVVSLSLLVVAHLLHIDVPLEESVALDYVCGD